MYCRHVSSPFFLILLFCPLVFARQPLPGVPCLQQHPSGCITSFAQPQLLAEPVSNSILLRKHLPAPYPFGLWRNADTRARDPLK